MPIGHLKVNDRPFQIDWTRYNKSLANPFAAKLTQGTSKYEDLQDWSAWTMDNWQAGVGQSDPEIGGYSFGELDTRFEGKLFLPGLLYPTSGTSLGDGEGNVSEIATISAVYTVGSGETYKAVAKEIVSSEDIDNVWVYAKIESGVQVRVSIYTISAGVPNTQSGTTTFTGAEEIEGYYWYKATFGSSVTPSNPSMVVIEPLNGDTIELPVSPVVDTANKSLWQESSGSAWVSTPGDVRIGVLSDADSLGIAEKGETVALFKYGSDYVTVNETTWALLDTSGGYYQWENNATIFLQSPTDAVVFGDYIYGAFGDAVQAVQWDLSATSTSLGFGVDLFHSWNGYLYAATGNQLRYSVNGTDWVGPFDIGPSHYSITGMHGFAGDGNVIGISTEEGFYEFNNNVAIGRRGWGSISTLNGRGMVEHEGELFIPVNGNILYRYTSGGTLIDVWIPRSEELPAQRLGDIRSCLSTPFGLYVMVDAPSGGGKPTCWVWTGSAWHHVATLPEGMGAGVMYFDRDNQRLWLGAVGFNWLLNLPTTGINPLRDDAYDFQPYGWLETPEFYGGLNELQKDIESVFITGENITSDRSISVYWKDDDSTAWELLGTVTSNRQELIWSNDATRPNTRAIRLGFLYRTDDKNETPIVEAIRLKYHLMINDRWAWTFPILLSSNQQQIDGTLNSYTVAQQLTFLDTAAQQIPPVDFEDIDGSTYRVKIQNASQRVAKYEVVNGSAIYETEYYLTIAEV